MIDRAGHKAYEKAAKEDEERGGAMVGGKWTKGTFKFRKFKVADTTNITEIGVSGHNDGVLERVVFKTPIVLHKGEDMTMVMAKRIVILEARIDELQIALEAEQEAQRW